MYGHLNVQCSLNVTTTKKVVNFLGEGKCTPEKDPPEKILATRMRKGPPPYVGMGPRMVNPALSSMIVNVRFSHNFSRKLANLHLFAVRFVKHGAAISAAAELWLLQAFGPITPSNKKPVSQDNGDRYMYICDVFSFIVSLLDSSEFVDLFRDP